MPGPVIGAEGTAVNKREAFALLVLVCEQAEMANKKKKSKQTS